MLIGRSAELAEVAERIRSGRPMAILGEAGVGKTALIREAARATGRPALEGGALASLSWMPYLPVERALGRAVPEGDRATVASYVAKRIEGGVLILDDLHWADPDTLALLELLAGRVALASAVRPDDPGTPPALQAARAAGIEVLQLRELPTSDAEALVRRRRPELPSTAVRRVLEAARGNPFLLEELADSEEPSERVRLSLAGRVRSRSPAAREALAALGMLGRPAERRLFGGGEAELLKAGMVVRSGRYLSPRHALLGEAAVSLLTEDERRALHGRLARRLSEPGEAARHHFEAGEEALAYRLALEAFRRATRPGERAVHLGLAARCARGRSADELRLRAASLLVEAGFYEQAEGLAEQVSSDDREMRAEAALYRARARWFRADPEASRARVAEGLELVRGTGLPAEVKLRIEEVRFPTRIDWNPALAVRLATETWELARRTGVEVARARSLLGSALLTTGSLEALEHLEAAIALARRQGDHDVEFTAANTLVTAMTLFGDAAGCSRRSLEYEERARELHLQGWAVHFRGNSLWGALLSGETGDHLLTAYRELAEDPAVGSVRRELHAYQALALGYRGRIDEARTAIQKALEGGEASTTRSLAYAVLSEVEWLAGRPHAALTAAEACLGLGVVGFPAVPPAAVMGAWSRFELGRDQEPTAAMVIFPIVAGATPELAAIEALSLGRFDEACRLFDDAAGVWAGVQRRCELRCRWAAGEAARLGGDRDGARARLLDAEPDFEAFGAPGLTARLHRSLRAAGVRRAAARSPTGRRLSAREHEILALVGQGLSTAEIAGRLGLARSTVDSQVKSAMTKLGARTRRAAASLAGSGAPIG